MSIYKCKKCSMVMVNQPLEKINEHRRTHGQKPEIKKIKIKKIVEIKEGPKEDGFVLNPIKEDIPLQIEKTKEERIEELKKSLRWYKKMYKKNRQTIDRLKNMLRGAPSDIKVSHFEDPPKRKKGRYSPPLYRSKVWKALRYRVFLTYGRKCMVCGSTKGLLHIDHIKPKSLHPELALNFDNLQILCEECNLGKSNWDKTDWRPKDAILIRNNSPELNIDSQST